MDTSVISVFFDPYKFHADPALFRSIMDLIFKDSNIKIHELKLKSLSHFQIKVDVRHKSDLERHFEVLDITNILNKHHFPLQSVKRHV